MLKLLRNECYLSVCNLVSLFYKVTTYAQMLTSPCFFFLSLIPQHPELLSCPIRLFWAEKCMDRVSFRMFNLACSCRVFQFQILTYFWVRRSWKDSGSQCHDMHTGIHLLLSEMILQVETSTYSPTSFQPDLDFALPQFSQVHHLLAATS